MCKVLLTKIHLRGCAKPLPGLTQTKSRVRENTTDRMTARRGGSDVTGKTQGMRTQARGTYVSVTEPALEGKKSNAGNKDEHCKSRCS
eukprot:3643819-Ditylum_brightwellii.AAC.1